MDVKKNPKADLESKKGVFSLLGYIVVLGMLLVAFEWTTRPAVLDAIEEEQISVEEEEMVQITQQKPPEPPAPPPPPKVTQQIEIVDNDVDIDDDLDLDAEADEDMEIELVEFEEEEEEEVEDEIFVIVEDAAEFPGGQASLMQFLAGVDYPDVAKDNGIQGTVFVQFVIEKDGSVTNVKVLRGVDDYLDEAAVKRVKQMPKWKPGMQRGKAVRMYYRVPFSFRLSN